MEKGINPATHGTADERAVASRIFDNLDTILEAEGTEDATEAPAEAEGAADERTEEDDAFDDEAAAALRGEDAPDSEDDESDDEPEVEDTEESDEAEDEEEEAPEPEEDEGPEEDEQAETYTVRVDGEDVEVTYDELLAGYSRTASWTQKSQALATERKAFEAEQTGVQAQREEYGSKLQALEQHFAQAVPKEPDADAPDAEWIKFQRAQSQLEAVQAEQRKVYDEWTVENNRQLEKVVEHETTELLEKVPEWKDEVVRSKGLKSLFTFATQTLGFDAETVKDVRDHRLILLLKMASEAHELKGAKETVRTKTKKAKKVPPGGRQSAKSKVRAKKNAARKKGREALRESGSQRDAAKLFESSGLIDDLL